MMPANKNYKAMLDNFMSFFVYTCLTSFYHPLQHFTMDEFQVLWGSDPPPDANPTLVRSNTLKSWKKALSIVHAKLSDGMEKDSRRRKPHKKY
jgi:hypothetical protein